MLREVTSNNVRSARVSDLTNELKTKSSRDSGADQACGYTYTRTHITYHISSTIRVYNPKKWVTTHSHENRSRNVDRVVQ